jgi:cbb3-type cytochrome oxidase maturation protein
MDILYVLVPMSALLVLAILAVFAWAVHTGQFDDVEAQGQRILAGDDGVLDQDQRLRRSATEESTTVITGRSPEEHTE